MTSHSDLIEQGISDYRNTYSDWDLRGLIDEIIALSLLQGKLSKLVHEMKEHAIENYKGDDE